MSLNKELFDLYNKNWDKLISNGKNISDKVPANPLLLKVNESEYIKADLKVMIFGQETWEWHQFDTTIENGMNGYESFFLKEGFYNGYKKSSFWKAFNIFKKEIINNNQEKEVNFIWNNISKIGRNDGKTGVTKSIRTLERKYFNIIKEELKILKPDIVIFLTGNRDNDIKFNFPDIVFEDIDMENKKVMKKKYKASSKLISKFLPEKSVRLYHPSYFGGFNFVKNDVIKFVIDN